MSQPIKLNHIFYKALGFNGTLEGAEKFLDENPKARELIKLNMDNFTNKTIQYFRENWSEQISAYNAKYKLESKDRKKERDLKTAKQKEIEAEALAKSRIEDEVARRMSDMEKKYELKFKFQLISDKEKRVLVSRLRAAKDELAETERKKAKFLAKCEAKEAALKAEIADIESNGVTITEVLSSEWDTIEDSDDDRILV